MDVWAIRYEIKLDSPNLLIIAEMNSVYNTESTWLLLVVLDRYLMR